jgi:polysaccharide export outer membrane protein
MASDHRVAAFLGAAWRRRFGLEPLLLFLLLGAAPLACTRYPEIPEREVMSAPSPPPRPANLPPPSAVPPAPFAPKEDYRIGPEDVLDIHVWGHDDLSKQVPVSQTGDFSFPLIGQVKASGRTVAEVQKEMIGRLGDGYLVNPQVTVTVKEYRSQKVFVVGEVKNPGTFPLTGPSLVMEVLAKAGGPTEKAGSELLVIRPKDPGRKGGPLTVEEAQAGEVIPLDLRAIQAGDVSRNIPLQHGDTVFVPKGAHFYVFGEVKNPGQFKHEQGITVLKAITIAGGLTDKAAARRTTVIREKAGVRVEIPARMSDLVEPNDIVMVPESFF